MSDPIRDFINEQEIIPAIPLSSPPLLITNVFVEDEGNRLLGTIELFGCQFHAEFLRVEERKVLDDRMEQCAVGDGDAYEVYERLVAYDCGYDAQDHGYQTFKLPGVEGDWILVITPFQM